MVCTGSPHSRVTLSKRARSSTIKDKHILKLHFCFGFLCTFNINYRWLFIYKRMANLLINQDFSSRLIDPEVFLKNYSFQQHTINGNLVIISLIYISADRQSWTRPYQSFFEERPIIHIKWLGQEWGWQGDVACWKIIWTYSNLLLFRFQATEGKKAMLLLQFIPHYITVNYNICYRK